MGFAAGKSMTYSRGRAKESIAAMSGNIGRYRSAVAAGAAPMAAQHLTDFDAAQRESASESADAQPTHQPRSPPYQPPNCSRNDDVGDRSPR